MGLIPITATYTAVSLLVNHGIESTAKLWIYLQYNLTQVYWSRYGIWKIALFFLWFSLVAMSKESPSSISTFLSVSIYNQLTNEEIWNQKQSRICDGITDLSMD